MRLHKVTEQASQRPWVCAASRARAFGWRIEDRGLDIAQINSVVLWIEYIGYACIASEGGTYTGLDNYAVQASNVS